jgi:hypothetical protein
MARRIKMAVANWTKADSNRAREIWSEYQRDHDVSGRVGQTAGIDPSSGRVWLGESVQDVIAQRDAGGIAAPLFLVRVGFATYYRKGDQRWEELIASGQRRPKLDAFLRESAAEPATPMDLDRL